MDRPDAAGVAQLGGKDFDETLRNLISQKFKEKTGATMEVNDTGFSDFDAEKVKYKLSEVEKHDFKVNSMNHGKVAVSVTRAEFEEQISALITQAEFCLEGALEKAGLMLVPVSIGIVAGAQTSIRIAARIGRLNTMPMIGMGITAVALFVLASLLFRTTLAG